VTPEPERVTLTGEAEALLRMDREPATEPAADGAKMTFKLAL